MRVEAIWKDHAKDSESQVRKVSQTLSLLDFDVNYCRVGRDTRNPD